MKYIAITAVLMGMNTLSGSIDPYAYNETKHTQSKQTVNFNTTAKGHKKYYGREGVLRFLEKKVARRFEKSCS